MATLHSRESRTAAGAGMRLALAVADANWFSTENLFREVEHADVATLLLKCVDYRNAWQRGTPLWQWGAPLAKRGPNLWQREFVLPSGWMKQFPRLGMRPIDRSIVSWRKAHAADAPLALVMTYPHYLYLRDRLRPDLLVYFNLDDYTLYWPRVAARVRALELQAAREADVTICVSKARADELRKAAPEAADRIRHLPHGVPTASLGAAACVRPGAAPDDLASLPRPLLGYVGTFEDRVDWDLLTRLSESMPEASIVLIGKPMGRKLDPRQADYNRCVERPNVHVLGWRPQDMIAQYHRAFDVCLIPYRTDHPFNQACSPTKIMDYMVTGRPIVSTALPECLLYSHLFEVADGPDAFIDAVRRITAAHSDDGRAQSRYEWACTHTCRHVVDQLLDWLPI